MLLTLPNTGVIRSSNGREENVGWPLYWHTSSKTNSPENTTNPFSVAVQCFSVNLSLKTCANTGASQRFPPGHLRNGLRPYLEVSKASPLMRSEEHTSELQSRLHL